MTPTLLRGYAYDDRNAGWRDAGDACAATSTTGQQGNFDVH